MSIGKLSIEELERLLPHQKSSDRQDILAVPEIGEDCGAVQFNREICVVSTDPITATDTNIGYLAVNIACNDVYACGGECVGILITLLAPPDTDYETMQEIMDEVHSTCKRLNIELLGGHTERTDAVNRIVVNTTVIGKTERLITSSGAKPGDDIILTKTCGLEGTYILANDFGGELDLSPAEKRAANELLLQLSVGAESRIARDLDTHAMHDVTDGGLFGALFEILERSRCGAEIYEKDIPLLPMTKKICKHFGISPHRLIGSGSLLICSPKGELLLKTLQENGITAARIGKVTAKERIFITGDGRVENLLYSPSDELYKVYHREGQ